MDRKILPTITTLNWQHFLSANNSAGQSGWRNKVAEIDPLNLKELAIFVTTIGFEERQEFYQALEKTGLVEIPFVHIKSDMRPEEMDYLINRWQTKIFNHHLLSEFNFEYDLTKYFPQIYIENTYLPISENDLFGFAGLCLDFSHMEDARRSSPILYKEWQKIYASFPIGCGHISAVEEEGWFDKRGQTVRYSRHHFNNFSDFDYLKNFSRVLFPPIIALELENSLTEQLEAKDYIKKILDI